jgi:hypothetical protein
VYREFHAVADRDLQLIFLSLLYQSVGEDLVATDLELIASMLWG